MDSIVQIQRCQRTTSGLPAARSLRLGMKNKQLITKIKAESLFVLASGVAR